MVCFELTENGLANIDSIMELTFWYIRLILEQGVQKWIYDEAAQLQRISFHFSEKFDHFRYVTSLAANMEKYPPIHALSGPNLFREFSPNEIRSVLNLLTPELCQILVSSRSLESKCDLKERWYGVD